MIELLTLHVIFMVLSLVGTAGMALAAASSVAIHSMFIRIITWVTAAGTLSGIGLLLAEPIGIKCVVLASYVAVFALTYRFVVKRNQLLAVSSAS